MYKIKYEVEDNSINLRYLESIIPLYLENSMVIVTTSSVSQTSLIEAQSCIKFIIKNSYLTLIFAKLSISKKSGAAFSII